MVSIPFHQVVRAITPVFTVLIYFYFHKATYSRLTLLSLTPIVVGVAFSTYGDYSATIMGFLVTLLASLKTVETNRMQTAGARIPAWELPYRMSPLACAQNLLCAYLAGEFKYCAGSLCDPKYWEFVKKATICFYDSLQWHLGCGA